MRWLQLTWLNLLSVCIVLGVSISPAASQDRIALVIGNSEYTSAGKVPNATGDATKIGAALQRLGFSVTLHLNTSFPDMERALTAFGRNQSGAKIALFYYAGHAYQVDGRNLLLPIDAQVTEGDGGAVRPLALDANVVVGRLETLAPVNMMFLDACRDNMFKHMNPRNRGLATFVPPNASGYSRRIQTRATGSLVAFSTAPDATASDGAPGGHSPFANAMLQHMEAAGLSLNDLMDKVKADVAAATDGKQRPWTHSSLTQPFYFHQGQSTQTQPHEMRSCADMLLMAKLERDPFDALGEVQAKCFSTPEGQEAEKVRRQLVDARNCERALTERSISLLQNYLSMHPNGVCASNVVTELKKLGLGVSGPTPAAAPTPPDRPKAAEPARVATNANPPVATRGFDTPQSPPAPVTPRKETPPAKDAEYGVLHFLKGSELNIRKLPGSESDIMGKLQLGARNLYLTGAEQTVDGKRWVEITTNEITGWVNSNFIAPTQKNDMFRWTMEPHYGFQINGSRTRTLNVTNYADCVVTCVVDANCKAVEYQKGQCIQFSGQPSPMKKIGTTSAIKRSL